MKLLTAVILLFGSLAFASTPETIKLYAKNEEILKIIEIYSKASGQKFIVDPGVRGKISILNQEPIGLEEAFSQLSSALAINGFAISKQGDTMIIKSARNIQRDLIEVTTALPSLKPERMVTWIYTFKNASATQVNRDLRILPSKDGEMNVNAEGNQVILSDWTSNLHRISELLKVVDTKPDAATAKLVAESRKKDQEAHQKKHADKKSSENKSAQ